MKPITVTKTIERSIADVHEHLAILGNHEAFTDHMLVEWTLSGPAAGVGAIADVTSTIGGRKEPVRFEIIEHEPPKRTSSAAPLPRGDESRQASSDSPRKGPSARAGRSPSRS